MAGRRINDGMAAWIVQQIVLLMAQKNIPIGGAEVLVLGLTFKENCSDIRNTKVVGLVNELKNYNINVSLVDPCANIDDVKHAYGLELSSEIPVSQRFDVVVAAVSHQQFTVLSSKEWLNMVKIDGLLVDLKGIIPRNLHPVRL